MQPSRESSVLFSLAELHRIEDERQAEERETRRIEEAKSSLAAQEARDIAAKRSADVKARAIELEQLRKQVQYSTAEGSQLKAKLDTLRKKQALSEIAPPLAPTVEFPQTLSRASHMWWAATVVAACAGVYLLVTSSNPSGENSEAAIAAHATETQAREAPPQLALSAPISPCSSEPRETSTDPVEPAAPAPSLAKAKAKPGKHRPRGGSSRGGSSTTPKPTESVVTGCIGSTDPLCGLENL